MMVLPYLMSLLAKKSLSDAEREELSTTRAIIFVI